MQALLEALERGPQPLIGDIGKLWGLAGRGGLAPGRGRRLRSRRDRCLQEAELGHRAVAEIGVDALEDLPALVFDVERARRVDAQHQYGAAATAGLGLGVIALRPRRVAI